MKSWLSYVRLSSMYVCVNAIGNFDSNNLKRALYMYVHTLPTVLMYIHVHTYMWTFGLLGSDLNAKFLVHSCTADLF